MIIPPEAAGPRRPATYECLLLPQTVSAGGFSVNITINGNKYTWTSGEDITLESNYKYELPIKVGKDYITAGNILVSDWGNGESLEGN
ncbi:MAG: fimbrillin family protein [Butyricimonas faecalis]